jgi:hypothetical protein
MTRFSRIVCAIAASFLIVCTAQAALVQTYQQTGTFGLEMSAVGIAGAPGVSSAAAGTLNISTQASLGVPAQAYLYALDSNHPGAMTASFNGAPVPGGAIGPYAFDSAFSTLYTWRWDVTSLITVGVTNYTWGFTEVPDMFMNQGNNISIAALALVYSDSNLPVSTATILDGMTYVGNTHPETESVNITNLPAGSNQINTLTYFDDSGSTGETIVFNGSTVGGPLDKNLSLNGSLTQSTGTSQAGTNAMSITTNADEFGWVVTTTLTTVVPVPPAVWLFGSALGLLGWMRRRREA